MTPRPRLFFEPISHYCVCAERLLAFKGIEVEIVPTRYDDRQDLLAATGQDYVPALLENGSFVPWSGIAEYAEQRQPAPTLFPWGQKGLALLLEQWGHLVLEEKVWRYVVTRVPPSLADDRERWVFEEMQTRARGPWSVLEMRREEFRTDMLAALRTVDDTLRKSGWLLGQPSLADFGVYGAISPLWTVGERIPEEMTALQAWADKIRAFPTGRPQA